MSRVSNLAETSSSSNEASNEAPGATGKRSKVEFKVNSAVRVGAAAPAFQPKVISKSQNAADGVWTVIDSREAEDEAPVFSTVDSTTPNEVGKSGDQRKSRKSSRDRDVKAKSGNSKAVDSRPSSGGKDRRSVSRSPPDDSNGKDNAKSRDLKKSGKTTKGHSRSRSRSPRESKKLRRNSPDASKSSSNQRKRSRERSRSPHEVSKKSKDSKTISETKQKSSRRSRSRSKSIERGRSRSPAKGASRRSTSRDRRGTQESKKAKDDAKRRSSRDRSRERSRDRDRGRQSGRYGRKDGSPQRYSRPSESQNVSADADSKRKSKRDTDTKDSSKKEKKKEKAPFSPATAARRLKEASDDEIESKLAKMEKRGLLLAVDSNQDSSVTDWTIFAQELAGLQAHHKNPPNNSSNHCRGLNSGCDVISSVGIASTLLPKACAERLFERIRDVSGLQQLSPVAAFHSLEFLKRKQQLEAGVILRSRNSRSSISHVGMADVLTANSHHSDNGAKRQGPFDPTTAPHRKQMGEALRAIISSWSS